MPLQGLEGACLRVSRVSARSSQLRPRSCRGVRDGAICARGGHRGFLMGRNYKKMNIDGGLHLLAVDVDGYPAGA